MHHATQVLKERAAKQAVGCTTLPSSAGAICEWRLISFGGAPPTESTQSLIQNITQFSFSTSEFSTLPKTQSKVTLKEGYLAINQLFFRDAVSMVRATHTHIYRNVAVEVVRLADFIREPWHHIHQLWNEQLPSLAVLPESSSSPAPKAKCCGGKRSNLTARNDGKQKENRRFGKDLGTEKIRNPYRPYRAASTLGSWMKQLSNLKHTMAVILQ